MTFKLLQDTQLYKFLEVPTEAGEWVDGVYYPGSNPVITYPAFEGHWEPVSSGQMTQVLPEGLQSTSAIFVITEETLKVAVDINGPNYSEGDVVYLEDPTVYPDTFIYDVWKDESWRNNGGFKLIGAHHTYICIRRERR